MPLRFRTVVPYTLPGVLALIGWWWYISRKKERLVNPDGSPTSLALRASPTEGSNGLVEKGNVSPTNVTERPTHRPPKLGNQKTEQENISRIHVIETAPLLGQSPVGISQEVPKPKVPTEPPPGKEESPNVSLKDHDDLEKSQLSTLASETNRHLNIDPSSTSEASLKDVVLPFQSTKVTHSSTAECPSDAERPEPEGEVAKHHSTISTQNDGFAITPAKVQMSSEADSLETPPSVQDFHQHILTSTPTSPVLNVTALTTAQDENIHVHSISGEEQDLELLAAGLITEVISAATKEVLGVTSCQVAENSQSGYSGSMSLASGRLCSQEELIKATQKRHHLMTSPSQIDCESVDVEVTQRKEQGIPNGCSSTSVWTSAEVSHRVHQTNNGQRGNWPKQTPQAAQSAPLLNMKLKGDDAATLAEDSACSTCHSEDGISNEDLQQSVFDNKMDMFQVTDLSLREATEIQGLGETTSEALVLAFTDENSVDAVCDVKRLDGMGLRNGAHGTCELETDQSGGE